MKKILPIILFIIISLPGFSQNSESFSVIKKKTNNSQQINQFNGKSSIESVFDLQFDYTLPRGGFAGITWTWSKFWVSKWQSDSVFIIEDSTGAIDTSFIIAGITGIRGMSFDGTSVWVANNTTTIYKVDTLTKNIITSITAPLMARGIAYDSAANGGAGGLWIANYATDIVLIDLAGTTINTVAAATHGLSTMYSIAYDPWTSGGPYIWAFDQGGGGLQNLVRINIASGVADLVHNVGLEVGGNGVAGGLSITGFSGSATHSFIGVTQASPDHVFGLELDDYVQPDYDASVDSIYFTPPYLGIPSFLIAAISWDVVSSNMGANSLDTIAATLTVNDGTSDVFTTSDFTLAVAPLANSTIAFSTPYTPPTQINTDYTVTAIIDTKSQADTLPVNDTISYSFSVTDTVMKRNGPFSSRIGIADGIGGTIGLLYEFPSTVFATSATFTLGMPTAGDSVYAELFDWNGSTPNNLISRSATYIITDADTDGIILTLPFNNAPFQLAAGSYVVGIHEHNNNVSIAYSRFNYHPNTTWINALGQGWLSAESYNFKIVPFINLNIWSPDMVSVPEIGKSVFAAYPSPGSAQLTIDLPFAGDYNVTVMDVQNKIIYRKNLRGVHHETINTSTWSNGMYVAKVEVNGKSYYSKIVVSR